ncbi:MAG: proteasome accessory factor [Frankiaceae bacterium]|jgi:proteasome accessory factor B|nr:proteasome accessory factor [Frankiaceae bacterium]
MAARRTERLLNLVICLLHTRSYLTAERIREMVAGYDEAPTDEAFKRMFERDKEDLRDLGIPLETGANSAFDDEPGYRIARRDYALPEITLEPGEAAAVGLAARMWSSASMSASATRALRKLEAAGVEMAPLPEGLQPRVEGSGVAFPLLAEAVHDGRVVTFPYRTAGGAEPAVRTVEPWGVVWWHGRWYLAGHDRDRGATRVFRLSRIAGDPKAVGAKHAVTRPPAVELTALVAAYDAASPASLALVRVRVGRCLGLRRLAVNTSEGPPGWDVIELTYPDPERLADQVLPYGADAVVTDPPDAVEAVVRRLRALSEQSA